MTISTVAVGTDGSATAAEAVNVAVEIARGAGARVVLLSIFRDAAPGGPVVEAEWSFNTAARVREILDRAEHEIQSKGIECSTLVDEGDPGDVLVRLAEECGADVLVVGNKGMNRRVLGSVPNTITHKASCSVLVVKTT
jgi:nucleotide-binding universal stress UspA family protein